MGGASLTLGMSHSYAFGLRLEFQRFLSYIGVVSRSLFPKQELKSEGHFKETHFALVRRFRASHIDFPRDFPRLGGDCKISFILDQAFRRARAVLGQLEFSFAGRRGGTIPAFSANRRHNQTKHFDIHAFVPFCYNNSQCQYKRRQQSPPLGGNFSSLLTMLLPPIARWASIFTYPHRPPSTPFIKSRL